MYSAEIFTSSDAFTVAPAAIYAFVSLLNDTATTPPPKPAPAPKAAKILLASMSTVSLALTSISPLVAVTSAFAPI